jgi:hypothetical protein
MNLSLNLDTTVNGSPQGTRFEYSQVKIEIR